MKTKIATFTARADSIWNQSLHWDHQGVGCGVWKSSWPQSYVFIVHPHYCASQFLRNFVTHFNRVTPRSRGNLGTIEVSKMAHSGGKIRLCDRDVYPAITEGPANVFSSIPFLLVKARYDIKLKAFEVVVMYISWYWSFGRSVEVRNF